MKVSSNIEHQFRKDDKISGPSSIESQFPTKPPEGILYFILFLINLLVLKYA